MTLFAGTTIKRLFLGTLAVLLLGATIFVVNLLWFRPLFIDHFFEREFIKFGLMDPEQMTMLGILDETPFDHYNRELTDASMAQYDRLLEQSRRALETLRGYDRDSLSPDEQLSYDVFEWFLVSTLEGERFKLHSYAIA